MNIKIIVLITWYRIYIESQILEIPQNHFQF